MAQTYDASKVSVIVNSVYLTGFMDGSFIKTEKNEDNVKVHVGADGSVTYSENADGTGTITVTLKQNSSSLAGLQKLANEKTMFATSVIDTNDSAFKAGGTACRILRAPSREFGSDVNGVEVQIHVSDYTAN